MVMERSDGCVFDRLSVHRHVHTSTVCDQAFMVRKNKRPIGSKHQFFSTVLVSSMNTNLWGVDGHAVNHGIFDTLDPTNERAVVGALTMVSGSFDSYPCSHCRKSSLEFLHVMRKTTGKPLEAVIRDGEASRWMFDYHNLINDKLDRQAWSAAMLPLLPHLASRCGVDAEELGTELVAAADAAKAFRGKRISFDTYQKRLRAGGSDLVLDRLSAKRVFRYLRICAFDVDAERLAGFRRYVKGLAICIGEVPLLAKACACMLEAFKVLNRDLDQLVQQVESESRAKGPVSFVKCLDAKAPTPLFEAMARAEFLALHDREPSSSEVRDLFHATRLFAARSCVTNDTCV